MELSESITCISQILITIVIIDFDFELNWFDLESFNMKTEVSAKSPDDLNEHGKDRRKSTGGPISCAHTTRYVVRPVCGRRCVMN